MLSCVCRGTFYPGTGAATEVGRGKGEGFTVNVPWETDGMCDSDYMAAMEQVRSFNLLRWQGVPYRDAPVPPKLSGVLAS